MTLHPHPATVTSARSLLDDLQQRRTYPSITLLVNTSLDGDTSKDASRLIELADDRLRGDVDDGERRRLIDRLRALASEPRPRNVGGALALCVSPDVAVAVPIGWTVQERVVIDDTFATRDLVADVNRMVDFQVITVSERVARLLVGDRRGLREVEHDDWPLRRDDELSDEGWRQALADRLRQASGRYRLPTVVAGVERAVRRAVDLVGTGNVIGSVTGNHDRTSAPELHQLSWPIVEQWLERDREDALLRLDAARSARRYAGGVQEIWPLASEGRVELVVVEETYAVAGRVGSDGGLELVDDPELPGVTDDVVDEVIEAVLQRGGRAVIVPDGDLGARDGIAAVLRY